jgi:hypothetical protein
MCLFVYVVLSEQILYGLFRKLAYSVSSVTIDGQWGTLRMFDNICSVTIM